MEEHKKKKKEKEIEKEKEKEEKNKKERQKKRNKKKIEIQQIIQRDRHHHALVELSRNCSSSATIDAAQRLCSRKHCSHSAK